MTDSVAIEVGDDYVATIELRRPPNNFFSLEMVAGIADALESLDDDPRCRAAVLCAQGKHFCAGADFSGEGVGYTTADLYAAAVRIFRTHTPVVAAVQGAAVGGGLGLALAADFRIAAPEARFSANFARLGFHQGFGLSVTLPRLVGPQVAADLLYTGRRVPGEEAANLGLADGLADLDDPPARGPRHRPRDRDVGAAGRAVHPGHPARRSGRPGGGGVAHEHREQDRLQRTADFAEAAGPCLSAGLPSSEASDADLALRLSGRVDEPAHEQ